jgi:hypothetical protein
MLFIHEENDDLRSYEGTHRLFEASINSFNEFLELSGALRSQFYKSRPSECIEKVGRFLLTKVGNTLSEYLSTRVTLVCFVI